MLFIRKDKVEMVAPQYYEEYNGPIYDYREPVYERHNRKMIIMMCLNMKKNWINLTLYMIKNRKEINMINFLNVQLKVRYNHDERTEEEPSVLSRQAKYKQKSTEELGIEDDGYYAEPEVDPKELKAQQKREKAEIKAKKKKNVKLITNE